MTTPDDAFEHLTAIVNAQMDAAHATKEAAIRGAMTNRIEIEFLRDGSVPPIACRRLAERAVATFDAFYRENTR